MIRCVILDDEPLILRGIKAKIERTNENFQVVGTASDGIQGIEIVRNFKPDVVFTDIKMPMMDGLDLAEEIRKIDPELVIVILSGYKEFDYAQRAIRLNVEDYLVKPIDTKRLEQLLQKIQLQVRQKTEMRYEAIISEAVKGEISKQKREFWNRSAYQKSNTSLIAVKICIGPYLGYRFHYEQSLSEGYAWHNLHEVLEKVFEKDEKFWTFQNRFINEKIVICYIHRDRNYFFKEFWKAIERYIYGNTYITGVVSGGIEDIGELGAVIENLEQVLYHQAVFGQSGYIFGDSMAEKRKISEECKEEISNLSEKFRAKHGAGVMEQIGRILNLCEQENATQEMVLKVVRNILRRILQEDNFDENIMADVLVFSSKNYQELLQNILRVFNGSDWLEAIDHKNNFGMSAIVDNIVSYIHQHKREKISVQDLAEQYHISHPYLCTIFKKYLNMSPTEYIIAEKISYAKKLLTNGRNMSVGEISLAVGYDDPFYFSRLFKAHTGLTPSKYRKENQD